MVNRVLRGACLVVVIVGLSFIALAQGLTATLNGTVTDPTGAVIPNAQISISQANQGTSRTILSNAVGSFTVTNLPAGTYTVKIQAPGFKEFVAPTVTLFVAQTRSLNAVLELGMASQTVTVQQSAVALETTTSEVAGTISGTQVAELQLNNRNFEQLVTLQPGVVNNLASVAGFGASSTSTISINGSRVSGNNWTVDGADINDSGSNTTLLNVPSVDAIQEFTMERSTYDAQYGRSGGGQVLVSTKSGTSQYSGVLYEFNRNDVFNANSYFNNRNHVKRAVERYNNFGFTLGGPFYIPKVYNASKDRAFFFWSEEWRKESLPASTSSPTPAANELNGVFAGTITNAPVGCISYDAVLNRSTINPSCYSQNAKAYLAIYKNFAPNSGTNLNITSYSQMNNFREDLVRLDFNLSPKWHFFARGMRDDVPQVQAIGLFAGQNFPGPASTLELSPGHNAVGNLTWTISPRMVNEIEFAFSQGEIKSSYMPEAIMNSSSFASQLTGTTAYPDPYGRNPGVTFTGHAIQGIVPGSTPYRQRNEDRNLFDNYSATLGKHTVRTGFTIQEMLKNQNTANGDASFQFNDFADFLLGNVATYTQVNRDIVPKLHYFNIEAYGQDDWQLTRTLTLNLGLRYSYFPSPADQNNVLQNFDPELFSASAAPKIDAATGKFVAGQGIIPATYTNGFIFPQGDSCKQAQAISSTVQCSPWGNHVNPDQKNSFAPRVGFAYAPDWYQNRIAIHGGFGIFFDRILVGIWNQNAFTDPPLAQSTTINNTNFDNPLLGSTGVSLGPNHIVATGSPTMPTPYYMDYNLTVQDQILPNTLFEVAYVGTLGRKMLGEVDTNQPTMAARQAQPTASVLAVLPYLGYNWIAARIPYAMSSYNSLQMSVNHRVQHGLTLGIAYTYSKNLTNASYDRGTAAYNTYDHRLDYGPSSLNQPHTFSANYVYELPFYKEQHGVKGRVLGGWQVSGIVAMNDGFALTVRQKYDNFDCANSAGQRVSSGCVAGTYPGGLNMDQSADFVPRPDRIGPIHRSKNEIQWFSTSAFADAVGHFGSSPNGVMQGPGVVDFDIAAMKNIKMNDHVRFQLRGEFFNAFNHTNFSTVGTNSDLTTFGNVTATGLPRNIQFGGKMYF